LRRLVGGGRFREGGTLADRKRKGAEAKNPRDNLPLHRQRAVVLTTAGARARIEKRKREIQEEKEKEQKKKEKKQAQALWNKRVTEAWQELRRDSNTGLPAPQAKMGEDDVACFVCLSWYGAWQEAGLRNKEFPWLQCCGCDQWLCPYCVYKDIMQVHEAQCKAEQNPKKARHQVQKRKRKRDERVVNVEEKITRTKPGVASPAPLPCNFRTFFFYLSFSLKDMKRDNQTN